MNQLGQTKTSPVAPLDRTVQSTKRNGSDRMDIDDGTEGATLSSKIHQQDASRPAEAISSPESTAQTATTPAVLDTSTNTSPEHDGTHYMDKAEDKVENGKHDKANTPTPHGPGLDEPHTTSAAGSTSAVLEVKMLGAKLGETQTCI